MNAFMYDVSANVVWAITTYRLGNSGFMYGVSANIFCAITTYRYINAFMYDVSTIIYWVNPYAPSWDQRLSYDGSGYVILSNDYALS